MKKKKNDEAKPSKETQAMATYIAMVVRNTMENFHAAGNLSDGQMRELNPIIRNAICTALYAFEKYDASAGAKAYFDFNLSLIPSYWEQPQLTDGFLKTVEYFEREPGAEELFAAFLSRSRHGSSTDKNTDHKKKGR